MVNFAFEFGDVYLWISKTALSFLYYLSNYKSTSLINHTILNISEKDKEDKHAKIMLKH